MEAFKVIPKKRIQEAREKAWSIENMKFHEESGEDPEYIGSEIRGKRIYDYYLDSAKNYWYRSRIIIDTGEAVTMEEYIFGRRKPGRRIV